MWLLKCPFAIMFSRDLMLECVFTWIERGVMMETAHLHFSGGVIVIVCAVNSSSKYLVSVSDDTWGLKGGISWGRKCEKTPEWWKEKTHTQHRAPVCAGVSLRVVRELQGSILHFGVFIQRLLYTHIVSSLPSGQYFSLRADNHSD